MILLWTSKNELSSLPFVIAFFLFLGISLQCSQRADLKAEPTGAVFLRQYFADFTVSSFAIQSELGISTPPAEPNAERRKEEMRMAQTLMLQDSLMTERTLDPFSDHRISNKIVREFYSHIVYNQIPAAEDLFQIVLYSSGVYQQEPWETYLVTEHFFLPDLDSELYCTIAKDEGKWKVLALGRAGDKVTAATSTGLARVSSLPHALRYPQQGRLMTCLRCKTPVAGNKYGPMIWKGRESEFKPQLVSDFIKMELEPYAIEPAFLMDADFPLHHFADLARFKKEKAWDFTLLVPGPMDGILYCIPVRMTSSPSTDRLSLSPDGRVETSCAIFRQGGTARDLIQTLLPILETWQPVTVNSSVDDILVPPSEVQPKANAQSDQGTSH